MNIELTDVLLDQNFDTGDGGLVLTGRFRRLKVNGEEAFQEDVAENCTFSILVIARKVDKVVPPT